MIDDNPDVYGRHAYRHKLEAFCCAMEDFDEIVFLDWDTKPNKELPVDFWENINKKDIFQSSLWRYVHPKLKHRKSRAENKCCPSGGLVYMREKWIPKRLLELHATAPNKWSEEPSFAFFTDELMDGWKGLREYWKRFEPDCYSARKTPYRFVEDLNKDEDKVCFTNKGKPWGF